MKHPLELFTIGHSTRSLEDFMHLLRAHGIRQVIDVRTIPRSRHNPQYNKDILAPYLRNRRIGYRHMKELGGLRHPRHDSPNSGWRNPSFRGFADYMQTAEFSSALEKLVKILQEKTTVILCAEAVPWRCHRSLIADALTVRGVAVQEIIGTGTTRHHELTAMAVVQGTTVLYPPPAEMQPIPLQHADRRPS